jgi:hypothetical protein
MVLPLPFTALAPHTERPFGIVALPQRSMMTNGESLVPVSVVPSLSGAWKPCVFRKATSLGTLPVSFQIGSLQAPSKYTVPHLLLPSPLIRG